VARFPGEHSLALGTPGLHDESQLGFGDVIETGQAAEAVFDYLHTDPISHQETLATVLHFLQ